MRIRGLVLTKFWQPPYSLFQPGGRLKGRLYPPYTDAKDISSHYFPDFLCIKQPIPASLMTSLYTILDYSNSTSIFFTKLWYWMVMKRARKSFLLSISPTFLAWSSPFLSYSLNSWWLLSTLSLVIQIRLNFFDQLWYQMTMKRAGKSFIFLIPLTFFASSSPFLHRSLKVSRLLSLLSLLIQIQPQFFWPNCGIEWWWNVLESHFFSRFPWLSLHQAAISALSLSLNGSRLL